MTTLNLAIIISLFMLIPFVVTLTFLIRLFRKYPSYSVVKVSMILIFTSIWCVSGLPWVLNVKDLTNQEIILIEKIGSILGLIGRIMFAVIFAKPNLGRKVYRFASVSFFSSTLLLGIRLLELIDPSINYYGIKKGNVWYQDYHPFIMIMLNLSIISLMLALVYGMSIQDKLSDDIVNPSLKSLNKIIVVLFFLAGVVSILNFTIVSINNYIILLIFHILSRMLITFAFLLLSIVITKEPLFIFQEKGNFQIILKSGIVGWFISSLGNMGPQVESFSEEFIKKYMIDPAQREAFAASVITVIGISQSFENTSFIIPFSKNQNLSAISYSFKIGDKRITDNRLKQTAIAVFSIIIPDELLSSVGKIYSEQNKFIEYIKNFTDIEELIDITKLNHLTLNMLKGIF